MQTRREFITGMLGTTTAGAALARAEAGSSPRWQIGCYTRPWMQFDYLTALDGIAAAGFGYAGLMTARSPRLVVSMETTLDEAVAIGEAARQRGLKIASVYGGGFPAKESIDAGISGLRRIIDNTRACGCPELMLGGTSEELEAVYYKVVAQCCDYAAAKGVALSVKPHGGGNSTGPQCRRLIERVGHPNFRLWYDPANIFFYSDGKLDPVDDSATVDGLVAGMSVKDFQLPKEVNVTPGAGLVDFSKVFARLKRGGFTGGPLIIECLAADARDIVEEARKARMFVEQLVAPTADRG
jgi:sugar phosphate isomerase/epimerase